MTAEQFVGAVLDVLDRLDIDWPYVERWCAAHGTWPLLDDLRAGP